MGKGSEEVTKSVTRDLGYKTTKLRDSVTKSFRKTLVTKLPSYEIVKPSIEIIYYD
jgi:hypothetical protein